MTSTEQVKQAIEDCKKAGHEIGIRDIAYVFLSKNFDDIRMPYRCLFGLDVDYNPDYAETYDKTGTMEYLKGYVDMNFSDGTKKKKKNEEVVMEEENTLDAIIDDEIDNTEVYKPVNFDEPNNKQVLEDELKKYAKEKPDQVLEIIKSWISSDER